MAALERLCRGRGEGFRVRVMERLKGAEKKMRTVCGVEIWDLDEVADALGATKQSLRKWIREGKLPASKIGNRLYVSREGFERFLKETEREAGADGEDDAP